MLERCRDRIDVLAACDLLHIPAVSFVAFLNILCERNIRAALDRDAVAVIERDQLAELHRAGHCCGFRLDALHHAAVAHIGVVIDDRVPLAIENGRKMALRHCHADRRRDTLAQRTARAFHAHRVTEFRMSRRFASPLTELLEILDGERVAEQMQQRIFKRGSMPCAQHKAVARLPRRIFRIMLHLLPQRIRHGRGADRHAGMPAVGLLHRLDGKHTNRGDRSLISTCQTFYYLHPSIQRHTCKQCLQRRPANDTRFFGGRQKRLSRPSLYS